MQKEALPMSSTDERIKALYIEHLAPDGEPNFDAGLDDTGVSSVDAVAFIKKVGEAFSVSIPPRTSRNSSACETSRRISNRTPGKRAGIPDFTRHSFRVSKVQAEAPCAWGLCPCRGRKSDDLRGRA